MSSTSREWKTFLSDAFLPVGFPHSVTADYIAYQAYDSLQAFFSTISSLLSSRAFLRGLGVGDAGSSATFALLLTILKDVVSRLSTIIFAHRYGLAIAPEAKQYRFLADLLNDTAFFIELASPWLDGSSKALALAFGQALRGVCGVSAGASKAALSVHFARFDNLAELNAKEASQETAVGLLGLAAGTLIVRAIEAEFAVWSFMFVLVFAHLATNYLGVRSVVMTTLNRQRASLVMEAFLSSGRVLTPNEVARRERILFWSPVLANRFGKSVVRVEPASNYVHAFMGSSSRRQSGHVSVIERPGYVLFVQRIRSLGQPLAHVRILLRHGCEPTDAVEAWFATAELAWLANPFVTDELLTAYGAGSDNSNGQAKLDFCHRNPSLYDKLRDRGWDLGTHSIETGAPIRLSIRSKTS